MTLCIIALQGLGVLEPIAIIPALTQQPRGQLLTDSRQSAQQIVIRMLLEQCPNPRAIHFKLPLQHAQRFGSRQRPPGMSVGTQCVGEAPGIEMIGLTAAWGFAVTVPLGSFGIERKNRTSTSIGVYAQANPPPR